MKGSDPTSRSLTLHGTRKQQSIKANASPKHDVKLFNKTNSSRRCKTRKWGIDINE